jgi:predicted nuclease of restriction endonuclease-like (RecB) superfamily
MMFERTAVSRLPEATIREDLQQLREGDGTDFAFLARQKRMTIGNQDFYFDLLFYHRRLARLIAIDLKLGRFEAGYKGQNGTLPSVARSE